MQGRFLDAFTLLPTQRVICGYNLKPMSLRHRLVLMGVKSPYIEGDRVPEPEEVCMTAKILASSTLEEMMTPPSPSDIKNIRAMKEDEYTYMTECESLAIYMKSQHLWPTVWEKKRNERDRGVPWILSAVCNLVQNGVSLEDAWTMPESQAIWMSMAYSIGHGADIDLVSDDDLKTMEFIKRKKAEKEAAEAAKKAKTEDSLEEEVSDE